MALRVVVVEDHALMRAGIVSVLTNGGISVVGTATTLGDARELIGDQLGQLGTDGTGTSGLDAVVTDIRMPPTHIDEGIVLARELRHTAPELGVVVLSQHVNTAYALAVLDGGTGRRAYLLKDRVAEEQALCDAVRAVVDGGSVVDRAVVDALMAVDRHSRSLLSFLTARERDVLEQMATGASNSAVARALQLSERSVEKHSNSVFAKLGLNEESDVNRRVKAVLVLLSEHGTSERAT